jgi:hypothetical protein
VVDNLAPVHTCVRRQPKSTMKWMSGEAVAAKRQRRRLERSWRSTKDEDLRKQYRQSCRATSKLINQCRAEFCQRTLDEHANNPRRRWQVLNELLHSKARDSTGTDKENCELCLNFSNFFQTKITNLKLTVATKLAHLGSAPCYPDHPHSGPYFDCLTSVTSAEVRKIIASYPNKSSPTDFVPTSLIKACPSVFSELIATLANLSFKQGCFPTAFKCASVTPLLKKAGLDASLPCNYRPISNLNTISKIIERLFLNRIQPHIFASSNFNQHQSGFRPSHSTETALLSILDSIYTSSDSGNPTLLVSLDLSAAFDTIDHSTLLHRLRTSFGVTGAPYKWIESYLSGRSQFVTVRGHKSCTTSLCTGVPQGTVLSPFLFSIYTSPLVHIAASHSVSQRQYADDTQLYVELSSQSHSADLSHLETCLSSLNAWFCHNGLSLNPDKSEVVLFGTRQRLRNLQQASSVNIAGTSIRAADSTKILGVTLDQHLTMNKHVNEVCRAAYYHIRSLRQVRRSIPTDVANAIACSLVSSRLDYANATLYGTSQSNITKLQRIQNAAARVVLNSRQSHTTQSALQQLHWLPVPYRINYKIAKLTFKIKSTQTPQYLSCLINQYATARPLRSTDLHLLAVPRSKLNFGARAFRVASPTVWNQLPLNIRTCTSPTAFNRLLKTFYYNSARAAAK